MSLTALLAVLNNAAISVMEAPSLYYYVIIRWIGSGAVPLRILMLIHLIENQLCYTSVFDMKISWNGVGGFIQFLEWMSDPFWPAFNSRRFNYMYWMLDKFHLFQIKVVGKTSMKGKRFQLLAWNSCFVIFEGKNPIGFASFYKMYSKLIPKPPNNVCLWDP